MPRTAVLFCICLGLCNAIARAQSSHRSREAEHRGVIRFQIEDDRLNGSDDGHTYSLRLFLEWPHRRPATAVSINFESLTRRNENTRLDLLGIDATLKYPVWRGGRFGFSGGIAVNGDLGGESVQNTLHRWLNEPELHLAYPDTYSFGLTGGGSLDQKLAEFDGFGLTGSGSARVASGAAPSWVQGGVYLGRPVIYSRQMKLEIQFGISVHDFFWLDDVLKPYYGEGYSLDSRLFFEWKRLAINAFFFSDPYGIDQSIFGVGFGVLF